MKYVVKNNLIVNKYNENGIYPESYFIEFQEDLGCLYNKYNLPKFKVVENKAVERTEAEW